MTPDTVQKAIDALTNAAGTKGYAFAEVHPRIARNRNNNTIDLIFDIEQGPRVYIGKINIVGNTRTLDKVIRREFRLVEGDAFNRVLIDRSRTRIRAWASSRMWKSRTRPAARPTAPTSRSPSPNNPRASSNWAWAIPPSSQLTGEFSYTEQNLFGRAQYLKAAISISQISKLYQLELYRTLFSRPAF